MLMNLATHTISMSTRPALLSLLVGLLVAVHTWLAAVAPARAEGMKLLTPIHKKPPVPDFVLEDLNGNIWQLSRLKGKVVIINFWSISCPVCRVEMPALEKLWKKLGKLDVQVLTIHVGHDKKDVIEFIREHDLSLPVLHDANKSVARAWGVFTQPITFVLDTNGRVAYMAFGGRNWLNPTLERMILALRPPL